MRFTLMQSKVYFRTDVTWFECNRWEFLSVFITQSLEASCLGLAYFEKYSLYSVYQVYVVIQSG